MRVAFLTPEYLTEKSSGGGVGNYVYKMASALRERGVESEIFVTSSEPDARLEHRGLTVHRVRASRSIATRAAARLLRPLVGPRADLGQQLANARRLADALEARHREAPFDVVQSANYRLVGAFVPRAADRRHLIRISTARTLFDEAAGRSTGPLDRLAERLDVRVMRRADAVYAPSAFLAGWYRERYGLDVGVVRPPSALAVEPSDELPPGLPQRYLMHFGSLGRRKGTDLVAAALTRAWELEPDLRMVWAGPVAEEALAAWRASWGARADQVTWTGPLAKGPLYGALRRADAAVLPSRADNLPNTVIECLALGVPVIGGDGASLDELVEPGRSGALVPMEDPVALGEAMAAAWRAGATWLPGGFRTPATLEAMRPDAAVAAFLEVARRASGGAGRAPRPAGGRDAPGSA